MNWKGFCTAFCKILWKKNNTWNIRHLVNELFVPLAQRTSVLYCRLTHFRSIKCNAMQACAALKEVSRKWDEAACNFNAWRLDVWINATKLCLWSFWNNQQFVFKLKTFDPRTFVPRTFVPRTFVSQVFAPWTFVPWTSLYWTILPPEELCITVWKTKAF